MLIKSNLANKIFQIYNWRIYSQSFSRSLSSSMTKENITTEHTNDQPDSTFKTNRYSVSGFVEPVPIKNFNIVDTIEKISKPDSIFQNYFLGNLDNDILSYPTLLRNRKEYLEMMEQYEMIRKTFFNIKKDDDTLTSLGYYSLHELSVSEMMNIFEAIGASLQKKLAFGTKDDQENRFEKKMSKSFSIMSDMEASNRNNTNEVSFQSFNDSRDIINLIIPLLTNNALVNYSVSRSSNQHLKDSIRNNKFNIGFAFSEKDNENNYFNWKTTADLSLDNEFWVVSGEKCKIIKGDYSHYLLFCKTDKYTEMQPYTLSNNPGIVALIVPREQVKIEKCEFDQYGIEYETISLKNVKLSRNSSEIIKAQKDISEFLNVKGCGQIATAAIILGFLKQLQKNTYSYLVNHRFGLTKSELIQHKLFKSTSKIYAIESMLYMTAAMFDSFEHGGNLEGETMTVKTLTVDYAYDVLTELRSIHGSRYPFASTAFDLVYYLDSFLGTSLNNRIYLGQKAINHYINSKQFNQNISYFPMSSIYMLKSYIKYKKIQKDHVYLTKEMTKYIHHNMHSACDWIEHTLQKLDYTTNFVVNLHREKIMEKHIDLNRLISVAMDIFMMTSCLSRANNSLCYGRRNNDAEKELCLAICKETFLKNLQLLEDSENITYSNNDMFIKKVVEANLESKGYFPSLFEVE